MKYFDCPERTFISGFMSNSRESIAAAGDGGPNILTTGANRTESFDCEGWEGRTNVHHRAIGKRARSAEQPYNDRPRGIGSAPSNTTRDWHTRLTLMSIQTIGKSRE